MPTQSIRLYVLAALYTLLLVPATLGAYAGVLWVGSDRGWQTQCAAGALLLGWLSLIVAGIVGWRALLARSRINQVFAGALILLAFAFYAVVFAWGGRMLI